MDFPFPWVKIMGKSSALMKRGSGVLSARRTGVVSIQPKTPEQAQTICKFPENLLISEMRTVQPKVLEIPGKKI